MNTGISPMDSQTLYWLWAWDRRIVCSRLAQAPKQDLISKQKISKQDAQLTKIPIPSISNSSSSSCIFNVSIYMTRLTLFRNSAFSIHVPLIKSRAPQTWSMWEGDILFPNNRNTVSHICCTLSVCWILHHLHDYGVSSETLTWMTSLDIFFNKRNSANKDSISICLSKILYSAFMFTG